MCAWCAVHIHVLSQSVHARARELNFICVNVSLFNIEWTWGRYGAILLRGPSEKNKFQEGRAEETQTEYFTVQPSARPWHQNVCSVILATSITVQSTSAPWPQNVCGAGMSINEAADGDGGVLVSNIRNKSWGIKELELCKTERLLNECEKDVRHKYIEKRLQRQISQMSKKLRKLKEVRQKKKRKGL